MHDAYAEGISVHRGSTSNTRRAWAARVTVLGFKSVCACVCLSVTTFSATMRNEATNKLLPVTTLF